MKKGTLASSATAGQEGLASRRSYQQRAPGILAPMAYLLRVVQKIHYLLEGFLGLVLAGDIGKVLPVSACT